MPLDPDTAILISLLGTAERLFFERGDRDAAVTELQRIAGGRADLLAKAAGHFVGADLWNSGPCYQLLVDAGALDQEIIDAEADRVRTNVATVGHTSSGTQSPRWPRPDGPVASSP